MKLDSNWSKLSLKKQICCEVRCGCVSNVHQSTFAKRCSPQQYKLTSRKNWDLSKADNETLKSRTMCAPMSYIDSCVGCVRLAASQTVCGVGTTYIRRDLS